MRTFIRSAALAVTLAFAPLATSFAASEPAAVPALAGFEGGKYTLDKSHANVLFSITHFGFSHYKGRFNAIDATLFYDAKAVEKSTVKATIDIASVDTNNAKLEDELKGAQFFDAAKFPVATFISTKFVKTSDTTAKVTGDLSLHGVTRPVTLDAVLVGAGENPIIKKPTIGFSATTTIKRSDFGVKAYVPHVSDEVVISIDAEFNKAE